MTSDDAETTEATFEHVELFTLSFWLKTLTLVIHGAAGAAVGVLGTEGIDFIHSLPWYALLSAIVFGGLTSLFGALASVKLPEVRERAKIRRSVRKGAQGSE